MIEAKIFGVKNCSNEAIMLEAANVEELLSRICENFKAADINEIRSCAVIINNEYVTAQERSKTELKDGDDVLLLMPIIGG